MTAETALDKLPTSRSMKQRALRAVRGSVPLTSLAFAVDNALAALRPSKALLTFDEHLGGSDIEADIAYAARVAEFYLSFGPLGGKVAEIGPGGSAAVALHLVAEGSDEIDLLDRFLFAHDKAAQSALYEEIAARLSAKLGRPVQARELLSRVHQFVGEAAAAEVFFNSRRRYNAIVSCAVLEHLYDPLGALDAMSGALLPGGRLLHQVDLRDHGMYTGGGHHELTFLSIPSWFYPLMSQRRGRPNRVLVHRYRQRLEKHGLEFQLLVNHLVGVGSVTLAPYDNIPGDARAAAEAHVEAYRPRLDREFRNLPAADLAIAGFCIVAKSAEKETAIVPRS